MKPSLFSSTEKLAFERRRVFGETIYIYICTHLVEGGVFHTLTGQTLPRAVCGQNNMGMLRASEASASLGR